MPKILFEYIKAINTTDIDSIYNLMSDDFLFIDSLDNKIEGKESMNKCWIEYFKMFPDYEIKVNNSIRKGNLICILGYASGTYKGIKNNDNTNYWKIPAAWTAIIENNKIKFWQVYADNSPIINIVKENEKNND